MCEIIRSHTKDVTRKQMRKMGGCLNKKIETHKLQLRPPNSNHHHFSKSKINRKIKVDFIFVNFIQKVRG
jgi:hypothetical protein